MIENVITTRVRIANTIPAGTIFQMLDERMCETALVMCKGHTANWSVFAFENGETFRTRSNAEIDVVQSIESWELLSTSARMDIELDLMIRGA